VRRNEDPFIHEFLQKIRQSDEGRTKLPRRWLMAMPDFPLIGAAAAHQSPQGNSL
jgi:hypothetical protein